MNTDIAVLRQSAPLVHCITNYVAMPFTANALLALGASPVMAHAPEEVAPMAQLSQSLLLNIGTLDEFWLQSMLAAGQTMAQCQRPIVLDPVGVGATDYRTQAAWQIIHTCHPTIIRGNASEIMALTHASNTTRGVDSLIDSSQAVPAAQALAAQTHSVVVVSGAVDYITDGTQVESVTGGSVLQTRVTAMGCVASAIVAAMAAVNPNPMEAAVHAMTIMARAGERAAALCQGPGTMVPAFVDQLYQLTDDIFQG